MVTLGYGEFHSTDFSSMLEETLPLFLDVIVPPLVLYGVCSFVAEHVRSRRLVVPVLLFIVGFVLSLPTMGVLGAYGPAHVAAAVGFWAWPLLFLAIVGKVAGHWLAELRRERAARRSGTPR